MLRYLMNSKEKTFEELCRGLEFSSEAKRQFNIQVVRLFCKDWITKCLEELNAEQRKAFQNAINDKNSKLSSIIRKFKEDGNLSETLNSI